MKTKDWILFVVWILCLASLAASATAQIIRAGKTVVICTANPNTLELESCVEF